MKKGDSSVQSQDNLSQPRVGLAQAWARFWFTGVDPLGLHALRLLAGLLFLSWLLPFAGHVVEMYGLQGLFDRTAYKVTAPTFQSMMQRLGLPVRYPWSALYLCGENSSLLIAVYWLSIVVLVLFTIGVWPRVMSVLTWLIVASFLAAPLLSSPTSIACS